MKNLTEIEVTFLRNQTEIYELKHTMNELGVIVNTSYLGGRDWEDCCLRPVQAKS
jgi:hypothetical protein